MESRVNHWKLTSIGMAIVVVTAIATGLVVARWYGPEISQMDTQTSQGLSVAPVAELPPRTIATTPVVPGPSASVNSPSASPATSSVPPKAVTQACNSYAAQQSGANTTTKAKTIDIVKDAAIGAVGGAAVGALGGAIAGGGSGAGKGAAIGGIAGGGVGTLYGLYTNKQNDEKYRAAYAGCMKNKGYTG
jgi:hypothetical protein